jgi:hypothetical protein
MEPTTTPAARPAKRTAAKKQAPKSAERSRGMSADKVKATIVMSGNVDFRLGSIAASLGIERSALAAKLIDQGLRAYSLDAVLRQFSDRQNLGDGVSQVEPTAD